MFFSLFFYFQVVVSLYIASNNGVPQGLALGPMLFTSSPWLRIFMQSVWQLMQMIHKYTFILPRKKREYFPHYMTVMMQTKLSYNFMHFLLWLQFIVFVVVDCILLLPSVLTLQVIDGKLAPFLSKVIKFASSHVFSCSLCREKGFICELCQNGQVIYPFQESATKRYGPITSHQLPQQPFNNWHDLDFMWSDEILFDGNSQIKINK